MLFAHKKNMHRHFKKDHSHERRPSFPEPGNALPFVQAAEGFNVLSVYSSFSSVRLTHIPVSIEQPFSFTTLVFDHEDELPEERRTDDLLFTPQQPISLTTLVFDEAGASRAIPINSSHADFQTFACPSCQTSFDKMANLERHMRLTHVERYLTDAIQSYL